jgi:hypothetical protein
MDRRLSRMQLTCGAILSAVSLLVTPAQAATKTVDLDGNPANGAESQCDLNVLQTFPVKIENKVTNKAIGDAYTFSWKSAGPGGFTSSITPGSAGGVGAKWVWTTNQTVYSYTGSTCANDLCFLQTAGPDPQAKYCSASCTADGAVLTLSKSATPGEVVLNWTGGQGPFTVYRSSNVSAVVDPSNSLGTTDLQQFSDTAAANGLVVYQVRGTDCTARKTCASDTDCNPVTEGTCISRGPFSVPGRSLYSTDVTVSAASLTSSLITFFSPPKEVFRVTSTVAPGGGGVAYQQTLSNPTNQDVVVTVAEYPPGCCSQEHQINCDGECFSYLTDVNNCGGCGVTCPAESYCDNGTCSPACTDGQTLCGHSCFDLQTDRQNCGACGNVCEQIIETENCEGSKCIHDQICVAGGCQICPGDTNSACNNECTDIHVDALNCGGCGHDCNLLCPEGTVSNYCNGGGTCCCVQPGGGPEVCVPSSVAPFSGFSATHQPPRGVVTEEAPLCETPPSQTIVPAGGTLTDCLVSPVLSKEVPTSVVVCGDGIPEGNARCANGDPASQGTFMKLVPDLSKPIGAAYLTPYAIHVAGDPSSDGLIEPGEFLGLIIEVVNAGPSTIVAAHATIVSPPVDLSDDGIENPVAVTLSSTPVSFGNILGTLPSPDCTTPSVIHPAKGTTPFYVTIPLNHPSDTSRPFVLQFTGTVDGQPFAMDVPISVGIADRCDIDAHTGDYDGMEALVVPMAALLPVGDTVEFPANPFQTGSILPLKVRHFCGGVTLLEGQVDPPQIVGLSEQTLGALDVTTLGLDADGGNPNNLLFFWDVVNAKWHFNMNTSNLGPGTYTLTIRIAGRKEYVTGFVLVSN